MKLGLILTTYNRPEYLRQCLDSLKKADIPKGTLISVIDDFSTDNKTWDLIADLSLNTENVFTFYKKENRGVSDSIKGGFDFLFKEGCDTVMNLDSDAIVRPDFITRILELKNNRPRFIITGFHSTTKNRDGSDRHPILKMSEKYCMKSSVGGINMCMSEPEFRKYCEPVLDRVIKTKQGNWDHLTCVESMKDGKPIVCVVPSVIQHIGFDSSMNHREEPDTAADFVMEDVVIFMDSDVLFTPPSVQIRGHQIFYSDHPDWWGKVSRGEWEPETFDVLDREIKPGKIFIDIGAWNGAVSLYASKLGAKCYAIEPDKGIHETLEKNIAINKADISLSKLAIGNVNGETDLNAKGEFGDSESSLVVRFNHTAGIRSVDCLTLDGFISENEIDISEVCLIKIDIEAGEILLIPEAITYLQKHRPNIYIAFHPGWFPERDANVKELADLLFPIYEFEGMNGKLYSKDEFIKAMHTSHDHGFFLKGVDTITQADPKMDPNLMLQKIESIFKGFDHDDDEVDQRFRLKKNSVTLSVTGNPASDNISEKALHLPTVTLVTVNCDNIEGGITAIEKSMEDIEFGAVKFFSSVDIGKDYHVKIDPLNSVEDYSRFIVKELYKYIDTDYALIVQSDGYVKNVKGWDSAFLQFDYVGATWPYTDGKNVGNGGFSLRSKRFMRVAAEDPRIILYHPEDHQLCRTYRKHLERAHGIRFAGEEIAWKFSIEGHGKQAKKLWTNEFGFHGFPALGGKDIPAKHNTQAKATKPVVIINQPWGLGDHLFIVPLIRDFIAQGKKVIVPVEPHYEDINKHFPDITFVNRYLLTIDLERKDEYDHDGATVIPLRFADGLLKLPFSDCMKSKYLYFGKDWKQWRDCTWIRDTAAEDKLYYEVLGLKDGEQYNLINPTFRSDSSGKVNIHVTSNLKKVFMKAVPGYTLLDWGKVIQRAAGIYTVSTAILYLLELMELQATEIHLYCRRPDESSFKNVDYLFTKDYRLHL